jgi:ABC-2 type transport system ATP-binding protein
MSAGKISVMGSPTELKKTVGGDVVTVNLTSAYPVATIPKEIGSIVHSSERSIQILTANGEHAVPPIADFFRSHEIKVDSILVNKPNLDDVFMKYAKRRLADEIHTDASRARRDFVRHKV